MRRGLALPAIGLVAAFVRASFAAPAGNEPLRAAPDGRPLVVAFSDNFRAFRQFGEPGGIWRTTFGDGHQLGLDRRSLPTNGERELYVDPLLSDSQGNLGFDPFHIDGNKLEIVATPTPASMLPRVAGYRYLSGMISSEPSFSQSYGYFEMRAKLPGGKGLWPAFWLLPKDQSWPPEIDVMESVGDPSLVYSTVHSRMRPAVEIDAQVTPDDYHTFAVSWDARRLIWYVDSRKIGEQSTPADLNKPMFMIANLAVGGDWPGDPNGTTAFPAKLAIAYIRAYRFADAR